MSWTKLKQNINCKFPVYVSAKSSDSGHALTAFGYTVAAGEKYVTFWNSGIRKSNGAYGDIMSAKYLSNGTTFNYASKTFTWKYSLSKY